MTAQASPLSGVRKSRLASLRGALPLLAVLALAPLPAMTALAPRPAVAADMPSVDTLRAKAEAQTPDAVAFLSKAIQYKSVEDYGYDLKPDTKALMAFVMEEAKKMGFTARLAGDGLVVVLEMDDADTPADQETIGTIIHLDVVPASLEGGETWTHPPFSGTVADGSVWGRGAQDDKGALAASMWALKILKEEGVAFPRQMRLILSTKEEKSFESMTRYLEQEKQPDFGLVPDGIFFMQGEKGIADMEVFFPGITPAKDAKGIAEVVSWEGGVAINTVAPSSHVVISTHDVNATRAALDMAISEVAAGIAGKTTDSPVPGVTDGGALLLGKPYEPGLKVMDLPTFNAANPDSQQETGNLVLVSVGQAEHGSAPWGGRNAITETALVLDRMQDHLRANAFTEAAGFVANKIGLDYYGGAMDGQGGTGVPYAAPNSMPAPPFNLPPVQYYGTSVNLGLIGLEPGKDSVKLSLNWRTGLGNDNDRILARVQGAAGDYQGTAEYVPGVGSHYPPVYAEGDHPVMKVVLDSYRQVNKDFPEQLPYVFFSPATTLIKLVDNFVNFGPVDLYPDPTANYFHTADEHIKVADLTNNIVLFAQAYINLLAMPSLPPGTTSATTPNE